MSAAGGVFYRDLKRSYPVAVRAAGCHIYDAGGRDWLDGSSGAVVSNIGHGDPDVAARMARQLAEVEFAHTSQFTTPAQEELAERVLRFAGPGFSRVYFVSGGSEATETALKMARHYHVLQGQVRRWRVVSHIPSYHGNSLGALAVSGHAARRAPYLPLLVEPVYVPYPDRYRGLSEQASAAEEEAWARSLAQGVHQAVRAAGPDTVMALVTEMVCGSSHAAMAPPARYFQELRAICDRYGILLVADEVMTGFGRAGANFAFHDAGIRPDLVTCGKGIAGGYAPLGAVVAGEVVAGVFEREEAFAHGFTYSGHPVACAAGCAVLEKVETEGYVARSRQVGADLLKRLRQVLGGLAIVGDVRGRGLMIGVEFVRDRATKEPFPAHVGIAGRVTGAAFERGLIVYPGGNSVLIAPPFIVGERDLERLVSTFVAAVAHVEAAAGRERVAAGDGGVWKGLS